MVRNFPRTTRSRALAALAVGSLLLGVAVVPLAAADDLKGKKHKVVVVKRASKKVAANKTVKVTLKLTKKQLRTLRKGLVKGKVKLTLSVKGTDAAGNSRTVNKTVTAK